MKIIRVITATAAGVILLSACGEKSDQARAQEYAIKACAIPTDDAGKPVRDSNGVVQFDASIGASLIYLDTDPISQLQAIHDDLAGLSANAQAASQLDSSWRSLADGIAMRTGVISVSLLARNRGENPFQTAVTSEDIAKYNQDLSEYKSECSGLATLLSE
jgi:hypothetical protein